MAIERWAMIDSAGLVTNICNWDGLESTWMPPTEITMKQVPDEIGAGWLYDAATDTWVEPTPDPVV